MPLKEHPPALINFGQPSGESYAMSRRAGSAAGALDCDYDVQLRGQNMLSVIIPAFNEEKTLAHVIERVLALPLAPQVIVVSDGSTDGTATLARAHAKDGVRVLELTANQGKAAALTAGCAAAPTPNGNSATRSRA